MPNNIKLLQKIKSKFLATKRNTMDTAKSLKFQTTGLKNTLQLKPKDPVFGITIKFLETGHPQFSIPDVSIEDTVIMLKNLEEAKAFCREFYNRQDEFIQDEDAI